MTDRSRLGQTTRTVLVCGSRDWRDGNAVYLALMCEPKYRGWGDAPIRVITGDCRGADYFAATHAAQLGYEVDVFKADWGRGKRGGPERNRRMLDEVPDLVIAFGRGKGTDGTVAEAERRGIPVRRF